MWTYWTKPMTHQTRNVTTTAPTIEISRTADALTAGLVAAVPRSPR
jgi:hypothetical protein